MKILIFTMLGVGFNVIALVIDRYSLKKDCYGDCNTKKRIWGLAIAAFFVSLGFSFIIAGFYLN